MRSILIYLVVLCPLSLFGQQSEIDSLHFLLTENSSDSLRTVVYRALCRSYRYVDKDSSLMYGEQSLALARKQGMKVAEIESLSQLSYHYLSSGEFLEAKQLAAEAFDLSMEIRDTFLMADLSNTLGLANWQLNDNEQAISDFQKSYEWAKMIGSDQVICFTLNNLGLISSELGRRQEAIEYFEAAGKASEEIGDERGYLLAVLNIAVVHLDLEEYDKALEEFLGVMPRLDKMGDKHIIAQTYVNIADCLKALGKMEEALSYCDQSLTICEDEEIPDIKYMALASKVDVLIDIGEYSEAIAFSEKAVEELKDQHILQANIDFYELLTKAYEKKKNYNQAFVWQSKFVALKDSLFKLDTEKEIAKLEVGWATKKKEAENELLRQEQMAKDLVIAQRTKIALATGAVLILLLIIAGLLYSNRRKTVRMNLELEKRVKERTEELEQLNEELLRSNEEIQRFAYIASHDLKEPIRNVGGFIGLIKKRMKDKEENELLEYINYVQKANWQMHDLINNILEFSNISREKDKSVLYADLNEVVRDVMDILRDKINNSKVEISAETLPVIGFNPSVMKMVLRRLIENAIKYNDSETPRIRIFIKEEEEGLTIFVRDNGIGIAPAFQEKIFNMFTRLHHRGAYGGAGMGVAYCRKLLANYGGKITVESKEGEGSTFAVILPAKVIQADQEPLFSNKQHGSVITQN